MKRRYISVLFSLTVVLTVNFKAFAQLQGMHLLNEPIDIKL